MLWSLIYLVLGQASCSDEVDGHGEEPLPRQYCGGMCYVGDCCTHEHPECPQVIPPDGHGCESEGMRCAHSCFDGEWHVAGCFMGEWRSIGGAFCDYFPWLDAGASDGDAGIDAGW
jgi:hypothetical protein